MLKNYDNCCQVDAISVLIGVKYAESYDEFLEKQILLNKIKLVSLKCMSLN